MARKIAAISALEILDSRGNPTVRVYIGLDNGITTSASVPSGLDGRERGCRATRRQQKPLWRQGRSQGCRERQ